MDYKYKYYKYKRKYLQLAGSKNPSHSLLIHISGAQGSGKTTIGNKYKQKYIELKGGNGVKEIYFIRHGQSIAQEEGKSAGQSYNVSISNFGKKQANVTGKYLLKIHKKNKFDIIISSKLKRAIKTAEIINDSLNLKFIKTELINELNQGIKEGKTNKEFSETKIGFNYYKMKNIDPLNMALDNFELSQKDFEKKYGVFDAKKETYEQINNRIDKFIKYLDELNANKIIVVTHGGFMLAFMSYLNKSLMRFDQYALSYIPNYLSGMKNCSISLFKMNKNKFKLILWGSEWHLQ